LDRKDQDELFKDAINQSLNFAYAHHIQRLMITEILRFWLECILMK
jgi:deoxyribodipyrimidine photolyase-like uncharacterized protein